MKYIVQKLSVVPPLEGHWENSGWQNISPLSISNFRPESSTHRPNTLAKLAYSEDGLHGIFRVVDRYVLSVHTQYQSSVCKDSCVEFFVHPDGCPGYFNFEFNCGGTVLASYITDNRRITRGFKAYTLLEEEDAPLIRVYHSLPRTVNPEITEETEWHLQFFIPFELLNKYTGGLISPLVNGKQWRANFYKCADGSSHPHWGSWAPVSKLDFHLPECFGTLAFAE